MRCPAQVVILCEASAKVEEVLKSSAVAAEDPDAEGLAGEAASSIMWCEATSQMRQCWLPLVCDNCTDLKLRDYDVHLDHTYTQQRKQKDGEIKDAHMQGWLQTERRPYWEIGRRLWCAWQF